jgi:hypothetical protein
MAMVVISGSAEHHRVYDALSSNAVKLWRNPYSAPLTGDGVPHEDLGAVPVEEKGEAVPAVHEAQALAGAMRLGESPGRDAVGRVQRGSEAIAGRFMEGEEAEERGLPVVRAEAAEEAGVGDEAAPALADDGGAEEGGRLRREAEEDLTEEVVVVQRGRRRRGWQDGGRAAVDHGNLAHLSFEGDSCSRV